MKERKLTINLTWANIFSFIVLFIVAIPTAILFHVLWPTNPSTSTSEMTDAGQIVPFLVFLAAMFAGIFVHELIHGLTWAHFAENGWKSISFGVIWKMLTPYCHCSEPLLVRPYIIGAMMPLLVMGIAPWLIGIGVGSKLLTIFGVLFISAASGDILVAWKLRHENPTSSVLDHPTEAGCIIYDE